MGKIEAGWEVGDGMRIDSDIVIVDKGRRERRRGARGGLRGRRGARRVGPCPMFCVATRYRLGEGERRELIETFEKYSRMGAPRLEVVPMTLEDIALLEGEVAVLETGQVPVMIGVV
jgi:hypothetical protein